MKKVIPLYFHITVAIVVVTIFAQSLIPHANASTTVQPISITPIVTPGFNCLGACPTLSPQISQTISGTPTAIPTTSSPTKPIGIVSPVQNSGNRAVVQVPCTTNESVQSNDNKEKKQEKNNQGFIDAFMRWLLSLCKDLLDLLIRLIGGQPGAPVPPVDPVPTPCPTQPTQPAQPTNPQPSGLVPSVFAPSITSAPSSNPLPTGAPSINPQPSSLALGVFKDGACARNDACARTNGPAGADSYAAWLGSDRVLIGQDNTGDDSGGPTWTYFEQGWPDSFSQWREWKAAKPGRRLALATPMFLNFEPGTNAQKITTCAQGGYDSHYRALATSLRNNNLGDTSVRIGWEAHFDGAMPWSYFNNPNDWKACWRRIAQQMKSVEPNLKMNWNMGDDGAMAAAVNLRGFDNFYPGDDVVDELGVDTYAVNGLTNDYNAYFGNGIGMMGWWSQLATQRNKPLTVPEWGLWDNRAKNFSGGSGDDAVYIQRMYDWMTNPANKVSWAAYFDYNVGDYPVHQLQPNWGSGTVYPNASAKFKQLFGSLATSNAVSSDVQGQKSADPCAADDQAFTQGKKHKKNPEGYLMKFIKKLPQSLQEMLKQLGISMPANPKPEPIPCVSPTISAEPTSAPGES